MSKTKATNRQDVLKAFQAAENAMHQLPENEWLGWIAWLLEGHDETLLTAVRDTINERLERGRW